MSTIDILSWLKGWIAPAVIVSLIGTGIALFKANKNSTDYAIVSLDGAVSNHGNFNDYGLFVEVASVPVDDARKDLIVPEYKLSFNKVPSYFEVTTREGAVVKLEQIKPLEFKLRFIGAGFGSPVLQKNFKVQAY